MNNKYELVTQLMDYCLFHKDESTDGAVVGDGIVSRYGFHPARLEEKRSEVRAILDDMSDDFKQGMSFLNLPFDRHGEQWGEQPTAGHLCALGNALGMVTYPLPRDMWAILPGGVPYVQIATQEVE